jgi:hypothetical protein
MGNKPKSAQDGCVNRDSEEMHLEELLDAALAGTFPASDPVSGLVHDRTKPPPADAPPKVDVPSG